MTWEQARQMIGKQVGEPITHEIERGAIRRFAHAVNDNNPLWSDPEYAASTRFGGIIAPPTYLRQLARGPIDVTKDQRYKPLLPLPSRGSVNGGVEHELFEPVHPGDTITAVTRLADVKEKAGKEGTLVFVITEITFTNQHGRTVGVSRDTVIYRV